MTLSYCFFLIRYFSNFILKRYVSLGIKFLNSFQFTFFKVIFLWKSESFLSICFLFNWVNLGWLFFFNPSTMGWLRDGQHNIFQYTFYRVILFSWLGWVRVLWVYAIDSSYFFKLNIFLFLSFSIFSYWKLDFLICFASFFMMLLWIDNPSSRLYKLVRIGLDRSDIL